ncbi:MAG: hypothetical protein RDU20_14440 [Desulfomonilaceae bacterium]|nr:hypothetical protein [Desulfomonilaceae bacterium]
MVNCSRNDERIDAKAKTRSLSERLISASCDSLTASILFFTGLARSHHDFLVPYLTASNAFWARERIVLPETPPSVNVEDYGALARFNLQIAQAGAKSSLVQMSDYYRQEIDRFIDAWFNTFDGQDGETPDTYFAEKVEVLRRLVVDYPEAIRAAGELFGFHFDDGGYVRVAETDRMELYQVLPNKPGTAVRNELKPIMVVHPYVLGSGILAFLPGENKSYVHAFANEGIPTYVRIVKNIDACDAVQTMTGEDDARDTAHFCRAIKERHNKPVTINGFCQGGFIVVADLLSGELDGLVDAVITCVAPLDGTRSRGLVGYLEHIAPRFRNLAYAVKTTAGGNEVVDGKVMSWVYKLKSIEREAPVFTYYRDINLFEAMLRRGVRGIGKTAAAINYWLIYDRTDLPVDITRMSFDSYTVPISSRGDLPVKLFGRRLNFDYFREKDIRFQICYASRDDLVDPPAALAPKEFIDVETTEFPKGHAAIATSWSDPSTEFALHKRYPGGTRGPVRFQLDLNDEPA